MRILFLSSWYPYPPINGAKTRIYNLLRVLGEEHEVSLISFVNTMSLDEARAGIPHLLQFCSQVLPIPVNKASRLGLFTGFASTTPRHIRATYSAEMESAIARAVAEREYDVVIASEVGPATGIAYYASKISGIPKILDGLEIGLFKPGTEQASSLKSRMRASMTWLKFKPFLKGLLRHFDACTVPSWQEKANIEPFTDSGMQVQVIPHGLDLEYCSRVANAVEPNSLIYTGSPIYLPNRDAILYFLNDIYPLIQSQKPNASFQVLGETDGFPTERYRQDPSISFCGRVQDVRRHVSESSVCVVPLRVGSGTRLKIIEAMALRTPVVSTRKGVEGLDVTPDQNILIADDPVEFAAQTLRLLNNPSLSVHLQENGRRLAEEKYDYRIIGKQFGSLLASLRETRREK